MIRSLLILVLLLPWGLAMAAPAPRVFATLADALASTPQSYAVNGQAELQVNGRAAAGDWGAPRVGRGIMGSSAGTNLAYRFNFANGWGQLVFDDDDAVDVMHWGANGAAGANDLAVLQAAGAYVQSNRVQVFGSSPGRTFLVRGTDPGSIVCYFSNLAGLKLAFDGSKFITDDFADDEFSPATLTNTGTAGRGVSAYPHGLAVGSYVCIKDASQAGFNGPYIVTAATNLYSFEFTLSGYSTPTTGGTGLVRRGNANSILFLFKACTNINLGRLVFEGQTRPRSIQYQLGWNVTWFMDDCRTVRGEVVGSGIYTGFRSGVYDADRGRCEDFDVSYSGDHVGYGVVLNNSGHRSRFRVWASEAHRGAYIGAVEDSQFEIYVRDYDVAGALVTTHPIGGTNLLGSSNLDILVDDSGTTTPVELLAVGGTRYMVTVAGYDINVPVTNRNIRATVRGRNMPATSIMQALTYRTNHWLDGFHLSGFIDQQGLALADVRADFYIDQIATTSGQFRGLEIENLTVLSPADVGAYGARLKLVNALDNPRVNNYRSGQPFNVQLPIGRELDVVPVFPGWTYANPEQLQAQQIGGGLVLPAQWATNTLAYSPDTNDLTVQWVGTVPASGDVGLWQIGPAGYATNNALGAAVISGSLAVTLYGASLTDYRRLTVDDWQRDSAGLVAELSVVRTNGGVAIFGNGHRLAAVETTAGTAPDWGDQVDGVFGTVGRETAMRTYVGTVYRFGVFGFDRQGEFPGLATAWQAGHTAAGDSVNSIDVSTFNGSFETGGGGGADVFASWIEGVSGSSSIYTTNDAVHGTAALAFAVDSLNSYASVYVSPPLTIGAKYLISLSAKSTAINGALSISGATDGEQVVQVTNGWQRFTFSKVWGANSIEIKRADGADRSLLVDWVEVRRVGTILDMDWSRYPGDLLSGRWPALSSVTASRIIPRGSGVSVDRGDASVTLHAGRSEPVQRWETALTAGRTATLDTNQARAGDWFRVVRTGGGTNALTVSPPGWPVWHGQFADLAFNGTTWGVTGFGLVNTNGLPYMLGEYVSTNLLANTLTNYSRTTHKHVASDVTNGVFVVDRLGLGTPGATKFLRGEASGTNGSWDTIAAGDVPSLPTSKITSGTFAAERLGTGTATTNTFLQGNGTNAPFWGTVPSTPSPTNGIADAPADGIFYGRRNNAWTQPDVADLSGVSGFGLSWIDGTVADSTDALDALDLIGAGVATIDSPATYAVRVGSGGTISTRHRLNLIASGGLSLAISDDAVSDESDVTVSVADAGITYAKIQNVTASKLLGRGASAGDGAPEEITLGTGLTMTGTTLSAASSGPTLLGWASFSVDPSYALVSVSSGGSVTNVTGNTLSNSDAMEVTLEFSGGPYATTYHVTADIEGTDDATDASYLPKWWIKQGGKQSTGVIVKASGWDQYASGASTPLGFTWTFWIWARE